MIKLDNEKLREEIKKIWETKPLIFEFVHDLESKKKTTDVKFCANVFNEYGWIKEPVIIADELTRAVIRFLRDTLKYNQQVMLTQTRESIVAPLIGNEEVAGADKYVTVYYAGNPELNPPDLRAWLILRITSPNFEKTDYLVDTKE